MSNSSIDNTIAMKTSQSGRVHYHLRREGTAIVLTVSEDSSGRRERTSYYPHVWEWVAESLGYVRPAAENVCDNSEQYIESLEHLVVHLFKDVIVSLERVYGRVPQADYELLSHLWREHRLREYHTVITEEST